MPKAATDLSGRVVERLKVIRLSKKRRYYWLCRCVCGAKVVASVSNLLSGNTKSCGCLRRELSSKPKSEEFKLKASRSARRRANTPEGLAAMRSLAAKSLPTAHAAARNSTKFWESIVKHGYSGTPEFTKWKSAQARCYNPRNVRYEHYGERGIVMCRRWRNNFEKFLLDMGMCPEGLTLDRIDNNGNYSCGKCKQCRRNGWPMNCRWATRSQQMRNRSPVSELARRNMSIAAIRRYQRERSL